MPRYILRTTRIDEIKSMPGSGHVEVFKIDFAATPEQPVEAKNMADLQRQFNAFAKSLDQCGTCYSVYAVKDKRDLARKFNGFDKASSRGGSLRITVNRDIAIAAAIQNEKRDQAAA